MGNLVKTNRDHFSTVPLIFDDFFSKDLFNWSNLNHANGDTLPAVNIKETDDGYGLEVAAPGMEKKDFKVQIDNGTLIVSAKKENKFEEKDSKGNYTRREFSYQNFTRTFSLPESNLEASKISAKYSDGILHITIPKTEEAKIKPIKEIDIK